MCTIFLNFSHCYYLVYDGFLTCLVGRFTTHITTKDFPLLLKKPDIHVHRNRHDSPRICVNIFYYIDFNMLNFQLQNTIHMCFCNYLEDLVDCTIHLCLDNYCNLPIGLYNLEKMNIHYIPNTLITTHWFYQIDNLLHTVWTFLYISSLTWTLKTRLKKN